MWALINVDVRDDLLKPPLKRTTSLHSDTPGAVRRGKSGALHLSESGEGPSLWSWAAPSGTLIYLDQNWFWVAQQSPQRCEWRCVCVCLSGWITEWVYQAQAQFNVTVNVAGWKLQLKEVTSDHIYQSNYNELYARFFSCESPIGKGHIIPA